MSPLWSNPAARDHALTRISERLAAWFPLLLLLMLAGLTYWLNHAAQPHSGPGEARVRHDPDYIIENFSATRTGENGAPRYVLSARKMLHYPDDDSTHLDLPRFVHTEPDKPPLRINASRGVLSSNGENAFFMGDVRVVREANASQSEVVVSTTFLHLIPDQDIAKTDRPVTITDANTIINAIGLELNNETRIIKLLSQVKGHYQKPK